MSKNKPMPKAHEKTHIFSIITSVFIALLLTGFLFAMDGSGYSGILEFKYRVFRLICCGYIVCIVLLTAEELIVSDIRFSDILDAIRHLSPVQLLIIAYMLLTLLSAFLSENRSYTWIGASSRREGTLSICTYCLCFLFVSMFAEVKKWMPYLLGASVLAFSVLCIIQLYGGNPFGFYPEGMDYYDAGRKYAGAFLGTLGNIDTVAGFFCLVVPLLTAYIIRADEKLKYVLIIPIAAALVVVFKMNVQAGFVGIFGACAFMLPVVLTCRARTRRIIAVLLLICLILLAAVLYAVDIGNGMFHEIHEIFHGNINDKFGSGRIYIWRQVLGRVPEHLVFGVGPDTMALDDIPPFERYYSKSNITLTGFISAAHNEYLNILYHQGAPALAAYMAALVLLAVKWVKSSEKSSAAVICGAGVLGYCIQAFFGISMSLLAPLFWTALALTERSAVKREKPPQIRS